MGKIIKSIICNLLVVGSLLISVVGKAENNRTESLEYPIEKWSVKDAAALNIDQRKIDKLFDLSFDDESTQAVVLIKDGFLVGERYAEGYDENSHGTSWSMAKSFYAALIGISIDRGEIESLDSPVAKYLTYFNDERSNITIRHILDMTSAVSYTHLTLPTIYSV